MSRASSSSTRTPRARSSAGPRSATCRTCRTAAGRRSGSAVTGEQLGGRTEVGPGRAAGTSPMEEHCRGHACVGAAHRDHVVPVPACGHDPARGFRRSATVRRSNAVGGGSVLIRARAPVARSLGAGRIGATEGAAVLGEPAPLQQRVVGAVEPLRRRVGHLDHPVVLGRELAVEQPADGAEVLGVEAQRPRALLEVDHHADVLVVVGVDRHVELVVDERRVGDAQHAGHATARRSRGSPARR